MFICLWDVFGLGEETQEERHLQIKKPHRDNVIFSAICAERGITYGTWYGLSSRLSLDSLSLKRLLGWRGVFWEEGEDLELF